MYYADDAMQRRTPNITIIENIMAAQVCIAFFSLTPLQRYHHNYSR